MPQLCIFEVLLFEAVKRWRIYDYLLGEGEECNYVPLTEPRKITQHQSKLRCVLVMTN